MAPVKHPNVPAADQGERFSWSPDTGKLQTFSVKGTSDELHQIADTIQLTGFYNAKPVASFQGSAINGRGELEISTPAGFGFAIPGEAIGVIEEIYGIDQLKDIEAAPIFDDLDAYYLIQARTAAREGEPEDDNWTNDKQRLLYRMIAHGQTSFTETGFIYRQSLYRSTRAQASVAFQGINKVVSTAPALSNRMRNLLAELPAGEWLKKPPQVQYVNKGVFQLAQEWWWADAWSVVYGGSKNFGINIP